MNVEKLKDNDFHPSINDIVQVKETGHIIEVRYTSRQTGANIKKLSKDEYVVLETGEIKEFNHDENRADNKSGVAQSLKRLRDLINTNVIDPKKCLWATLTYAENMSDTKCLYDDFRKFNMRLRYNLKVDYEYIVACEPQARGAWHMHIIFIFPKKAPYIPNKELAEIWGRGFVKVTALKNVDNIGAYLSAYLGDMELESMLLSDLKSNANIKEVETTDGAGNKTKKYYVKGGRLKMYPVGFRLYRRSKGIKDPIIYECSNKVAMQEIGSAKLTYEKTVQLTDDAGRIINKINYRHFNRNTKL